ncbi:MAG TPA: TetR family transcriptional regulator [Micromonosporaceae bacterium]|nr:TetR family transcriptional regulator [Micromonosporaceae bacterium]
MARTGRRKGSPDTREAILDAAREAFAARGFDGASIRTIATSAAVDPALVHHYFGTKEQLFLATVGAPVNPGELIPQILDGDPDLLGVRLVRMFLSVWDDPHSGPKLIAIVRSALAHDWSARMLREFVTSQVLRRVIAKVDVPPAEAPTRAALVASQMIGVGLARHVLKIEPLASADADTVAAMVGPNVQHYLTGALDLTTAVE